MDDAYRERIAGLLAALQVPGERILARGLELYAEAGDLVIAETGRDGREYLLVPAAAEAWRAMRAAAAAEGVGIEIVSAFRSVERQAELVRAKLARGLGHEAILAVSAPPGYSEHHTGRAVDIGTEGVAPLEEAFEATPAYAWLIRRAGDFSFVLSYPRGNRQGYAFEPWHWCHRGGTA